MISPGWGKPFGQNIHLKGLKTFMKNRVADRGWGGREKFSCDFSGRQTHVHRFKLIVQIRVDTDINILLFSDRHYASTGGYVFTDQPYFAVCTMIVATVWAVHSGFSILDLPKHHLLYVCDSFLPFFISVLTSSLLPPDPRLTEGSKLQISVLFRALSP